VARKEIPTVDIEKQTEISAKEGIKGMASFVREEYVLNLVVVDPKLLDATIRLACERAIAAEPDLTKWDMVMGDGDCGEAVKGVSEGTVFLHNRAGWTLTPYLSNSQNPRRRGSQIWIRFYSLACNYQRSR